MMRCCRLLSTCGCGVGRIIDDREVDRQVPVTRADEAKANIALLLARVTWSKVLRREQYALPVVNGATVVGKLPEDDKECVTDVVVQAEFGMGITVKVVVTKDINIVAAA